MSENAYCSRSSTVTDEPIKAKEFCWDIPQLFNFDRHLKSFRSFFVCYTPSHPNPNTGRLSSLDPEPSRPVIRSTDMSTV